MLYSAEVLFNQKDNMSSYRKHSKNKTFVVTAVQCVNPELAHTALARFQTVKVRSVACTASEAIKGYLAFRCTPVRPPTASLLVDKV